MTRARDLAAFVSNADGDIKFDTDTLFIDSSANKVGIGTNSPNRALSLEDGDIQIHDTGTSGDPLINFSVGNTQASPTQSWSMRIDNSDSDKFQLLDVTDSRIVLTADGSGNVGIGTSSPNAPTAIVANTTTYEGLELVTPTGDGSGEFHIGVHDNGGTGGRNIVFKRGGSDGMDTESMRIDSSGKVMVGKTSDDNSVDGVLLDPAGMVKTVRASSICAIHNRRTSVGEIVQFRKDDSEVGAIGINGGSSNIITFFNKSGSNGCGLGMYSDETIRPLNNLGNDSDNEVDLGRSATRFDDIFATNGSIQTSDENEKQNIASLTSAEITAATAISKLFKTFKWKEKVAAKGDNARTHSGVIAQEVEKAMSDAGLDASKYAFWCSNTWWEADQKYTDDDGKEQTRTNTFDTKDEAAEGATERTRLGVRYPELLSFIGAATEQRLTSIEARLDALEAE